MNNHFFLNLLKVVISSVLYFSGILPLFLKIFLKKGLFIFNYHGFNTFCNDYWKFGSLFISNYKDNFEKHIRFFNKYFHKVKDFDLKNNSYSSPYYLLTFDDGYKDNFDIAFPILKKYSVPAIFFVTTGIIGSKHLLWFDRIRFQYENLEKNNLLSQIRLKRHCKNELNSLKSFEYKQFIRYMNELTEKKIRIMMNWDEIKQLNKEGFIIGSHSHTHSILTKLNYDQQAQEIKHSIEIIQKQLDYNTKYFSYPEGTEYTFNEDTVSILKIFGIKYTFSIKFGINYTLTPGCALKRIGLNPSDSIPILALKIIKAVLYEYKKKIN